MSEQKHKIQRQIIELNIPQKSLDARQMQREMSRIYRHRIVPLIDQYCSEFSSPDRLHRIDFLEIDLGQINPANLEAEVVAKFRTAMQKALTTQINEQEQSDAAQTESPKAQSQLELFSQFVRTGTIPWWADAAQPDLLQNCLYYLLTTMLNDLRHLITQFVQEKRPFLRLITTYKTSELVALVHLFQAPPNQMDAEFVSLLQRSQTTANKQIIWQAIFAVAINQDQDIQLAEFYTAVLKRIAAKLNTRYSQLLEVLHRQIQTHSPAPDLRSTVELLHQENQISHQPAAQGKAVSHLRQTLIDLQDRQIYPAALWPILLAEIPNIPPHLYPQLQAALDLIRKSAPSDKYSDTPPEFIQRILLLLQLAPQRMQKLAASKNVSPTQTTQLLEIAAQTFASNSDMKLSDSDKIHPGNSDSAVGEDMPQTSRNDQEPRFNSRFAEPDELYIENAGLVILWPFLSHFFTHLDMLQDKQFKDEQTQQRAVGLLQYIATNEKEFPEYLLPLNKILCGVELFEIFAVNAPIAAVEIEECDHLLTAVITQAPILRNMSIAGFRNTFLLREGVLRSRDGAWLLQVEHLTHDVVLDRFPWSWQWVKLPWMNTALRVEW